MRYKKTLPLFILCLLSCDDIFEKNISLEVVQLNTPQAEYSTNVKAQRFWWDQVDGAVQYNLKIASPDFESALALTLDTVISGTSIKIILDVGNYEWCVSAGNRAYTTDVSCRKLEITE